MANISLFEPVAKFNIALKTWMMGKRSMEDATSEEIKLSITENERQYAVMAHIPGVKKENIQVDIDGNRVAIRAHSESLKAEEKGDGIVYRERYKEIFSRSFTLSTDIDETLSDAHYKDGVLELKLSKKVQAYGKKLLIR